MTERQLITEAQNTWCPGCGNFSIQFALKALFQELEKAGKSLDEVVLVTGIGCHAKMADYLNVNTFYAIHGRVLPVATGIKLANPDLTVIGCAGDGDAYAEGLDHLIFAAKRNIDLTLFIHNNRVYGLTTGQYTPTSPLGFKGRSTPAGTLEYPFNPLELMFASGATYIARGYTRNQPLLKKTMAEAVRHHGFSFVDILQICATYFDVHDVYDRYVYELRDHDPHDAGQAMKRILEWDYNNPAPIGLGTFLEKDLPTFEGRFPRQPAVPADRTAKIRKMLEGFR
ncbi:MAG TPA: thiamine pyrophosphate-dependent enzyme [Methanomicrobiales archaeon]|nr:thiamine pyrophosphate-dependent enzyme [Methanomicrobiales archaeon]